MRAVVGIDPSLTGTAVCVMREDGKVRMTRHGSKPADGIHARLARYGALVNAVCGTFDHFRPACIAIEGYSFGSQGRGIRDGAEFGGLLRDEIAATFPGVPFHEIPPKSVKQFATGRGNADKMAVAVACVKRWGVEFATSDEYDAYVLARMAACAARFAVPENEGQRKAMGFLETKKPKEKKRGQ